MENTVSKITMGTDGSCSETDTQLPDALLLTVDEAAALLNVGRSFIYKLHSSGRLPLPVRLGRSVRWRRDELEHWVLAGCPERGAWETIRKRRT